MVIADGFSRPSCDRPALNCNRSALNADAQLEAIFLRA